MQPEGNHWIGNQAHPCQTAESSFRATNPSNGQSLDPAYGEATPEDVHRALTLAAEAHQTLKHLPRERRAELLEAIAEEIEALGDPLLERAHQESALPMGRLTGERGRTTGQLRLFATVVRDGAFLDARIDRAQPDRAPIPKPDVRTLRQPLGPVAIFGASNFPLAFSVAGGDTASAFAAGCPVVAKAHPAHPGTSELVGAAISRAVTRLGLPPGTFSLLHGRTPEVGAAIVQDPRLTAVGFTGSLGGGRALFDLAAARPRPIPVYAEMGSVNPVFLLPEALGQNLESLAQGTAGSVKLGVGQFCTNPGLLVALEGSDAQSFAEHLRQALGDEPAGDMLHPGIAQAYRSGLETLAQASGVDTLTPAHPAPAEATPCRAHPAFLRTTAKALAEDPTLAHEVFGPSTLLVLCSNKHEMLQLAQSLEGQLTATLHGTPADLDAFRELAHTLEDRVGRLLFGGFPTGVEVCHAMNHGGPYPATTAVGTTSVGTNAVHRFTRPLCYQNAPQELLPPELRDDNPEGLSRLVDGEWSRESL